VRESVREEIQVGEVDVEHASRNRTEDGLATHPR
jgi:hypothetical protein